MNPSSELIGEFKVTQFNNNAEFAQLGDVTIAVWGSNINGATLKPHKVFHTFGGSLGGPLEIPKLMRRKAKTFFFADYEGNRKRYSTPLFLFVPTAAMRTGDFSALSTPLIDPFTGQPYPGKKIPSGSQCTSSQDCINPVAVNLLNNYLPAPNIQTGPRISASLPTTCSKPPLPAIPTAMTFESTARSRPSNPSSCGGAGSA
jgi:hypothetical protein